MIDDPTGFCDDSEDWTDDKLVVIDTCKSCSYKIYVVMLSSGTCEEDKETHAVKAFENREDAEKYIQSANLGSSDFYYIEETELQ